MSIRHVVPVALLALFALPVGCAAGTETEAESPAVPEATSTSSLTLSIAQPPPLAKLLPATGDVDAAGMMAFVVGKSEAFPLVFRVASSAVKTIASGFEVRGDLTLDTPIGPLTLAKAEIVFEWTADRSSIDRFVGTVSTPAPGLGALSDFAAVDSPARATLGWDYGRNLKTKLDAPMLADRKYLAFDYAIGASASAGPVSFAAPGGKGGTMVLDPEGPSFFMTGGLLGLDNKGPGASRRAFDVGRLQDADR